ncbi:hypothetical protein GBA52_011147 [Prunus armeniaca]|nr:hypothetical protein GBA52_011147 [Prunus armeniaca]
MSISAVHRPEPSSLSLRLCLKPNLGSGIFGSGFRRAPDHHRRAPDHHLGFVVLLNCREGLLLFSLHLV